MAQLEQTTEQHLAERLLQRFLASYHIKSYAFTYYSLHPGSRRRLKYEVTSAPLKAWHQYYLESAYDEVDQTTQSSKSAVVPVYWNVQQQLKEARSPREKIIREESISFGIDKGYSIPIHGPDNDFAILVIHQRCGEDCFERHPTAIAEWFTAGYYYYAFIRKHLIQPSTTENKYQLTRREIQCLNLSSKNYLAKDIAMQLELTPRTVHYHLQNANKKLGTKNKFQSLNKILQDNDLRQLVSLCKI